MGRKAPRKRLAYRVISAFTRVFDAHDTPHGCSAEHPNVSRRSAHPSIRVSEAKLQTPDAKKRRGNETGCLKSETGMTNRAVGIACPGRGAARNEVERCTADPGPDWNGPRKSGLPDLRVFERRSRVNPRSVSAAHHSAMLHAAPGTRERRDPMQTNLHVWRDPLHCFRPFIYNENRNSNV
jgi:hypothetical protein